MGKKFCFVVFMLLCSAGMIQADAHARGAAWNPPGWAVQIYYIGTPWEDLVAKAFHFSPDGSFYEAIDEGHQLKISTTFKVQTYIPAGHKIPIDAGCAVSVVLDGSPIPVIVNDHTLVELPALSPGVHKLEIENVCGGEDWRNWASVVVGKCLWGTSNRISFVEAN
jgi:hypothetical protein